MSANSEGMYVAEGTTRKPVQRRTTTLFKEYLFSKQIGFYVKYQISARKSIVSCSFYVRK